MIRQLSCYIAFGGVGTLAHYVTLVVLVEGFLFEVTLATTIGFFIGALINYQLNYHYTFQSKQQHSKAAPRFFLISLSGAALNALLMFVLTQAMLHYLIMQIIATATVVLWTFKINRHWTFGHQRTDNSRESL